MKKIRDVIIYKNYFEEFFVKQTDYLWKRLTHLKTVNYLSLHYN